ncbi:inositol 2-dehydrogenase [Rubellimicrobium aerolatum]|uniref:Inositol 2-dehydrogenase n=1 Tax=Rubellimicrobium aerolatum TaxID=490979 RepID=A0ABW0SD36_9RHOB|nr:inositol 2-dehydrogenase [Rubellimicrobium aerolatum]MBP1806668.1 myo-inositol 2-dehydrogenase/D-chiro-inositol 1-dehydrogenase [Rubellimicrobium aerolatum]
MLRATLAGVFDLHQPSADRVAAAQGAQAFASAEEVFASPDVDAVLIATATPTHADYIEMAVAAGKAVLCEKPIDLGLERVEACAAKVAGTRLPIQIGFNRRYDPGHAAARAAMLAGEIGDLHQVIITSRDPGLPPRAYLEAAGGLFRDMTIHDFDLARFMLGEEPVEVFALANALIDPELGVALNEVDSAMFILRTASGKQCHINNSRTAVYGYDQRVELMGTKGMVISDNRKPHEMRRFTATSTEGAEPDQFFFLERYHEAFMAEIDGFVDCVEKGAQPLASFEDGRRALILAEAAYRSLREGRLVKVAEIAN